ncbi:iron import ATP-binding/permease protein IrtA [Gordonia spumicola]|uniref:Mycobactin import ATP-binding/permease protein IrtA n=1 Tax=Gordonia spumicola TaxID=589161 RepID=A0A7I9VAY2_9ACTN|nr:ATP-binding cassette domain-containing protein [Gordonia spumicola]GEE02180.1 iron import ATP-binding/permease protein IrtA [Gordonia spumicola]
MGTGLQGAVLRALGAKNHSATVTAVEWITDHVVRIDFSCDAIMYPAGEKPAAWIRAWFPDPDSPSKFHQRGYTFFDADPAAGTFAICFLVHEPAGPASTWAGSAAVGDELLMTRLGGDGYDMSDEPLGYLLLGDVASWPAFVSIVQNVPAGVPVRAVIEYGHDDDRGLPLPAHDALTVDWVPMRDDRRALVDAIGDADYRGWAAWVTAETTATRLAKAALVRDHGHNKATMHAQAYWVAGRAMGKQAEVELETSAPEAAPAASVPPPDEKVPSVLRPALPAMIIAGLFALLLAVLEVVPLVLFAELARRLVIGAERADLVELGWTALIVLVVGGAGSATLIAVMHFYDQLYAASLRRRVLDKLSRLPLGWFAGRRHSDVRKTVQDDVSALHYLITHAVPDIVAALVTPLVILGYLFSVEWRIALILLVPVVVYIVFMGRLATADKPRLTRRMQWYATLPGDAERFIGGQQTSRVFGDASTVDLPGELRRLTDFIKDWQHATIGTKAVMLQLNRPMTSMVLIAVVGTAFVTAGWTEATALLPFLILGTSFGDRLLGASFAANGLREGLGAKSGLDLLLTTSELPLADDAVALGDGPADVELRGVAFGYTSGRPVVSDFDLRLRPGTTTALIGPSGSGKSTVAALVARLWDPDAGTVLIDGVDYRDVPEVQLRGRVATVLQDVQLVRGTVAENIALGLPDVDHEAIEDAARAAFVHDVIVALPDGYDTAIDRESLSGGQRQRIAIARALLGDPALVVLDEATAAADPDSEWEVRQGLSRLLAGRTVLVVAHRLHTVADADHIVVLDGGVIVEQGTPAELLDAGGRYAAMTAQAQEALR